MTSAKAKVPHGHPDPEVVQKAEAVFAKMGMTPDEAIAIFYKQTALHGSFPITGTHPQRGDAGSHSEGPSWTRSVQRRQR